MPCSAAHFEQRCSETSFPHPSGPWPGQRPKGIQGEHHLRSLSFPAVRSGGHGKEGLSSPSVAGSGPLPQGGRRIKTKSHWTSVRFTLTLALMDFLAGIGLIAQSQYIRGLHKQSK